MDNNPRAALLVIGNEILNGRTADKNIHTIASGLFAHGVDLIEVRVVADIESAIVTTLHDLMPKHDYVFTTGGIGPTHDDITSACVAKACKVEYGLHPEADAILTQYYAGRGLEYNDARRRMAHTPLEVTLIENPISGAPGFQCRNVYVLPGVPHIMQNMFTALLGSGHIAKGAKWHVCSVIVHKAESEIAAMLRTLEEGCAGLEVGSYPRQDANGNYLVNVVIRHQQQDTLEQVAGRFINALEQQGVRLERE